MLNEYLKDPIRPVSNETGDNVYTTVLLDITSRCNLRCKHCFYYRDERSKAKEIPDEEFLERLEGLRKRYGFFSALWEGGEPFFRKDLLAKGVEKFEFNIIPTNGTVEMINLPNSIIVVSLDGPEKINDYIRGKGCYRKVIENTGVAVAETDNRIHFQCTISKVNQDYIEELTEDLLRKSISKLLFTFYVPQNNEINSEFSWNSNKERDPIVEKVLELKEKYPEFILNTVEETEKLLSCNCKEYTNRCFLKENVLPLRANLEERMFCCYGENPDCNRCGSWGVFHYTI